METDEKAHKTIQLKTFLDFENERNEEKPKVKAERKSAEANRQKADPDSEAKAKAEAETKIVESNLETNLQLGHSWGVRCQSQCFLPDSADAQGNRLHNLEVKPEFKSEQQEGPKELEDRARLVQQRTNVQRSLAICALYHGG